MQTKNDHRNLLMTKSTIDQMEMPNDSWAQFFWKCIRQRRLEWEQECERVYAYIMRYSQNKHRVNSYTIQSIKSDSRFLNNQPRSIIFPIDCNIQIQSNQ